MSCIPPINIGWIIVFAIDPLETFMFGYSSYVSFSCYNISTWQKGKIFLGHIHQEVSKIYGILQGHCGMYKRGLEW